MSFVCNDGRSLAAVPDGSIDLAFSFDSLVHADAIVMKAYVSDLMKKLSPEGFAFIHHSNLAAIDKTDNKHARDPGVSAEIVRDIITSESGHLLRQEIISWGGTDDLDCLTLFSAQARACKGTPLVSINRRFMEEAQYIREHIEPWALA
jgi:hypothetical protein